MRVGLGDPGRIGYWVLVITERVMKCSRINYGDGWTTL